MTAQANIPGHIAIVMDGNGRWAKKRNRPRSMGHQAGLRALRATIEHCVKLGVSTLTVFAFSSENWSRPAGEVSQLMEIFMRALNKEVNELHANGIRVRFIGEKTAFKPAIQNKMSEAEELTRGNNGLTTNVAVNYGGRWDITQAARRISEAVTEGRLAIDDIDETHFSRYLTLADIPDPDLLIRTGGEMRISNFMLWQTAYTELYFTAVLWPDFDEETLGHAVSAFQSRERRFGRTGDQVKGTINA